MSQHKIFESQKNVLKFISLHENYERNTIQYLIHNLKSRNLVSKTKIKNK